MRISSRVVAFVVTCALATPVPSAAVQSAAELASQRYDVDPMHSTVAFSVKIMGAVNVRGRFRVYDATVICDPAHPERSSVSVVIQATSVSTDMKFRDDHLRSPTFSTRHNFRQSSSRAIT